RQGTLAQSALEQSEREYLLRRATRQTLNNSLGLIPAQRRALEADLRLKQAQLDSARLDLDRTEIHAPYSGRVLEKGVDLGQSVSKGSVLAGIYAVDFMEVRLPVTDHQAVFLDLPETYADGSTTGGYLPVKLFAVGGKRHAWQGRVVRTEGAIDARTRQLFVIAQVDNPYSRHSNGRPPLKVGQFVEAEIRGRLLKDVFVLPRKAVRADDEVLLVTQEDRIQRRGVEVIWRAQDNLIVRGGLEQGDRISLTSLPYAPDGSRVAVAGRTSRVETGNGERRPVQSAGKDQTAGTVEQGRRPESKGEI
ncbi:MAG: efflux RND transporter periplasmic adaptor subunit, partial [Gammaproteobacteria bacterium]|nr:efflux RND transporter periplasmic adaptor subunit [Gammaproteobacteria bacterium]